MNKRGYTLSQAIVTMVVLSLVVASLMNLTYKIQSQRAANTDRQTLQLININKIEELNTELNTSGKLPVGVTVENLSYGFKPCLVEVSISGSDQDHIYTARVSSRFTGKRSRSVSSEVLLALEAKYE